MGVINEGVYTKHSYAKMNLHLQVGEKRSDSFHTISSLFQMISLHDEITLTITPRSTTTIECSVTGHELPKNNSMVQAAKSFLVETNLTAHIHIHCNKRIPLQSGLGGGSSNAASTLQLLQQASGYALSHSKLLELGSSLGSDVPFFIADEPLSYVTGKGEILSPIKSREDLEGLIVIPQDLSISTPWAYNQLDQMRASQEELKHKEHLEEIYNKAVRKWNFVNDFEEVVISLTPLYRDLKALVDNEKDVFGLLSGSGSAFYILSDQSHTVDALGDQIALFAYQTDVYPIKCLHQRQLGATVLL